MSTAKPKYKGTKITTPAGRASFPNLFTPKLKYQKTDEFEYTVDVLFDKDADLKAFKAACDTALAEVFGNDKKLWPKNISYPLSDQEILIDKAASKGQAHDHYEAGAMFCKFKTNATNAKPIVVDAAMNEIIDPTEIYGGCYIRVSSAIKVNVIEGKDLVTKKPIKNVYVTTYLQGVQKVKDGDSFGGGRASAESMFTPVSFDGEEASDLLG